MAASTPSSLAGSPAGTRCRHAAMASDASASISGWAGLSATGRSVQPAGKLSGIGHQRHHTVAVTDTVPVLVAHRRTAADGNDRAVLLEHTSQAVRFTISEAGLAIARKNLGHRPPRIGLDQ